MVAPTEDICCWSKCCHYSIAFIILREWEWVRERERERASEIMVEGGNGAMKHWGGWAPLYSLVWSYIKHGIVKRVGKPALPWNWVLIYWLFVKPKPNVEVTPKIEWEAGKDNKFNFKHPSFQGQMSVNIDRETPLDFFMQLFPDKSFDLILTESVRFAQQNNNHFIDRTGI